MGVGHGDGYYTCTGTKTAVPVHRSFGDGQIQLPAGLSLYEVAVLESTSTSRNDNRKVRMIFLRSSIVNCCQPGMFSASLAASS